MANESRESRLYSFIEERGIATEAEIILVTGINGLNLDTMWDIIWQRTANRSMEQLRMDGYDVSEEDYELDKE